MSLSVTENPQRTRCGRPWLCARGFSMWNPDIPVFQVGPYYSDRHLARFLASGKVSDRLAAGQPP